MVTHYDIIRKIAWCTFAMFLLYGCKTKTEQQLQFFRYNQSSGIASLDPAFAKDQATIWACNHLYNSLLKLDDQLQVQPAIARNWSISEDGLTYTFNLRSDVFFHDDACFPQGKPRAVTAQDVVYSFSRLLDPKTASPGSWIFTHAVDSAEPFKAVDDSTFVLKLRKPFRPMTGILTMQYASVIPREAVEKYGAEFRAHPVGTGPFKLKSWKEGTALLLERNDNYFETDDEGKRLPYLDGVKVSFIDNKKTEFLTFKQKQLDFISGIDQSYIDEVLEEDGTLKAEYEGRLILQKTPYLNTEYLGFYCQPKEGIPSVLQDKRIRQAINYSFNRVEMLQYLRNGVGKPASSGFTPYGLPSFNEQAVPGYQYNKQKALALLQQAGYPNGKGLPEITLHTNDTYKEFALFVSKQLEQIGFNIKVEVVQPSILREWMRQGSAAFFRGSWLADYPDAENYLAVFYSKNPAPPNYTRFSNKVYDALYDKALAENDDNIRYALYQQMERILIDEAPVVLLYYDEVLRFIQPGITGLQPNGVNLLNLHRVRMQK